MTNPKSKTPGKPVKVPDLIVEPVKQISNHLRVTVNSGNPVDTKLITIRIPKYLLPPVSALVNSYRAIFEPDNT